MGDDSTRCIDGRLFEHRPQHDDPDFEVDVGECPKCDGNGCHFCERCGEPNHGRMDLARDCDDPSCPETGEA